MSEKDLDIAIEKCERIMEFDTRTLENPESENGYIFEKVYDLLQFLRQFQFANGTKVGGMSDDKKYIAVEDILGWLLAYHTMSFDLKGRYFPHEVIGWLTHDISKNLFEEDEITADLRKEDERRTGGNLRNE